MIRTKTPIAQIFTPQVWSNIAELDRLMNDVEYYVNNVMGDLYTIHSSIQSLTAQIGTGNEENNKKLRSLRSDYVNQRQELITWLVVSRTKTFEEIGNYLGVSRQRAAKMAGELTR